MIRRIIASLLVLVAMTSTVRADIVSPYKAASPLIAAVLCVGVVGITWFLIRYFKDRKKGKK